MDTILSDETRVRSSKDPVSLISTTPGLKPAISFRRCRRGYRSSLKSQSGNRDCSWERILKAVPSQSPELRSLLKDDQRELNSIDRREFPRHASEALVLAFSRAEPDISTEGDNTGDKGYALNISQNGISFASHFQFHLRDELQLHLEDQIVNYDLDVIASVVRVTPIDDHFWRIDCKLVTALTDHQVLLLKEHIPSCYAE